MRRAVLVLCALVAPALLGPAPGAAEPTPGVNASLDRIVPEAWETNDFVSYEEARGYLEAIAAAAPEHVEVLELGPSYGWPNIAGGHDTFPVVAVEVTHEASAVPREQKRVVYAQLSIHGNEKGGREGGFRVIEDLAIPRGWGEAYRGALDQLVVVFVFPNPDGWRHEEPAYRHNCARYLSAPLPTGDCVETQNFVRFNGHLQDLNRDWPTVGWYNTGGGREQGLSEPEMAAIDAYVRQFRGRVTGAADIHGMLNPADGGFNNPLPVSDPLGLLAPGAGRAEACLPQNPAGVECPVTPGHFVLGLLAGAGDAQLSDRIARFGERMTSYLDAMAEERFPYWARSPNLGFAGGKFSAWGTGWDTIGYTDSGSTGRWIPEGLGAPGGSIELSYNHITLDNHYVPELNAMHVESVRAIVRALLDEALEPTAVRLAWEGTIGWLADPEAARRAGPAPAADGPHGNSTLDDPYEGGYAADPGDFWRHLGRFGPAGGLVQLGAADVAAGRLHAHRTVVVAGDAWASLAGDAEALRHLRMHLDQGRRLVLTDAALQGLEALGLAEAGAVEVAEAYLGYVDLDRDHPLAAGVRGIGRQTVDTVTLGYEPGAAPVWSGARGALAEGAEVAGTTGGADRASFGRVAAGQGEVVFLGAVLPSPTAAGYHPYRLGGYAVTPTGYTLLYNALGIAPAAEPGDPTPAPPVAAQGDRPVPAPPAAPAALAAGLVAALALAGRTRRR